MLHTLPSQAIAINLQTNYLYQAARSLRDASNPESLNPLARVAYSHTLA